MADAVQGLADRYGFADLNPRPRRQRSLQVQVDELTKLCFAANAHKGTELSMCRLFKWKLRISKSRATKLQG